jgi:aspartate aminotransferase-like enzyme
MGRQMINHRGVEFQAILGRITAGLKQLFQTEHDVLVLTTSGTGAMESVVVNMLSPGDKALVVSIGSFGDRFADIAQTYGAQVDKLDFEWGAAADPAAVAAALGKNDSYKAVFITHNETSTGVTNPLEAIAKAIRAVRPDILILVDAISSLGSLQCAVDAWDLDVVATGSQKGWMVPPGLAMVSVSQRAWRAWEQANMPRYYFDYGKARDFLTKGQTPWTPAVSIFFALDVALKELVAEGIEGIVARHRRYGEYTRREVTSMGLRILPEERYASNTVTATWLPEGITWKALDELLRTEYQVELQGGQGKLAGKIFRIGHLGWVVEDDLHGALAALRSSLPRLGYKLPEATPAG